MFGALGSPHANSFHIRFDQFPPHICVYVCVLSSFRVCASATYIIEKNTTAFFFLQSYGPLFHPVFPWRVLVCVCVCFHAFCFIALKGNAPEHPALLIPHTQTHATGLIQCLCGCPSGVVCKYSRDERTADENVPSALWIGWTQISVAFRDRRACLKLKLISVQTAATMSCWRAASINGICFTHTPAGSPHTLPYLIIEMPIRTLSGGTFTQCEKICYLQKCVWNTGVTKRFCVHSLAEICTTRQDTIHPKHPYTYLQYKT